MDKLHPSKVDPLYMLILLSIPIFGLVAMTLFALVGAGIVAFLIFIIAVIWPSWVLLGTKYLIQGDALHVSCGPLRYRIALDSIQSVTPIKTFRLGPALSRDKLEIRHSKGVLLISPTDKYGFVFDLGIGGEEQFNPEEDDYEGPLP